MISWMDIIEDGYRNSKNSKTRTMFCFYEKNLKPRIDTIVDKQKPDGIWYEAWIDLIDYFIPDNYEKLCQLDFDEAARLCYEYMIEEEQKY